MTLTEVDRTLYEHLRLALVAAGYLPDITAYVNSTAYAAALKALADAGGLVELKGVGHREERDEIVPTRVVIDYSDSSPGSFSGFPEYLYERVGAGVDSTFNKFAFSEEVKDIQYDIRVISANRAQDRLVHNVINSVLGFRKYLSGWSETSQALDGEKLLLTQQDDRYINGTKYIEHRYIYIARDVDIQGFTQVGADIPTLKTFPEVVASTTLQERTEELG
jgi:hypothetical protein